MGSLTAVIYSFYCDTIISYSALMLFVIIFLATMLTYPIFACVNAPIPIVGYCLGALYTDLVWVPDDVIVLHCL